MEVELTVLHATGLSKPYECFAEVYVQMDEGEPEVKLGSTLKAKEEHTPVGRKSTTSTKNPVWDSSTKNKFVVAIPFPVSVSTSNQARNGNRRARTRPGSDSIESAPLHCLLSLR